MRWTIESFTPSDGSTVAFVTVDHQAWLKGEGDKAVHVSLNISSRGVPESEAKAILDKMVAGLNGEPRP